MDKSGIHERVTAAFSDVPYPGDQAIGAADGGHEGKMVADWFRGRDWRSLKPSELSVPSLRYMTPEAFHYYFPAFLLAVLEEIELEEDPGEDAGDVYDTLISILTPPELKDHPWPDWMFQSQYRNFTPAQKEVVREVISLILEDALRWSQGNDDFMDAAAVSSLRKLKDYWDRF